MQFKYKMSKNERITNIYKAYLKYVNWWEPIDLSCDSCLAPMDIKHFLEKLLIFDMDEIIKWGLNYDVDFTINFSKRDVLMLFSAHCADKIDLNVELKKYI